MKKCTAGIDTYKESNLITLAFSDMKTPPYPLRSSTHSSPASVFIRAIRGSNIPNMKYADALKAQHKRLVQKLIRTARRPSPPPSNEVVVKYHHTD